MDGIPLASPEPAARPTLSRLEITVPEPSLVSEWNSENLHEFHSTSNRARTESDVEQRANRTRRSEPIPNKRKLLIFWFKMVLQGGWLSYNTSQNIS